MSMARKGVWALGATLAVALAVVVALPYVASTRIVRDRIASEMSRWSGYRVEISAPPAVHFWPGLGAVLDGVTFHDWRDGRPVASVERIEADLSALAALRGDAVFTAARLLRPTWRFEAEATAGFLPQFAGRGRILTAIEAARAAIESTSRDQKPVLPEGSFGTVSFADGRIVRAEGESDPPLVEAINGTITWPNFNAAASVVATARWNGESVTINVQSDAPLLLLAGGQAPLRAAFKAAPVELTFNGTARLVGDPLVDGAVQVAASSFDRLATWAGADVPGWEKLRSVSLAGQVLGSRERIKIDQATVKLDDSTGSGAIEADLKPERLAVSGSLAFDTLALDRVLDAFLPLTVEGQGSDRATLAPTLPQMRADLRLSAARGSAAGFDLADIAASIQIKDRFAAFDLLEASAFEGNVSMGLRVDRRTDGIDASLQLAATDVDGAALAGAAGVTMLAPTGRGKVNLEIKGSGSGVAAALAAGTGTARAEFGAGSLSRFDLQAFIDRCRAGGFFPLADTAGGSLPIQGFGLSAKLSGGLAHIDRAQVEFDGQTLWATGVASWADGGLALSGGVTSPVQATGTSAEPGVAFFVGGSWSAPFISPIARPSSLD